MFERQEEVLKSQTKELDVEDASIEEQDCSMEHFLILPATWIQNECGHQAKLDN